MYLRDYLNDIPLKALKAIAGHLQVPVEYGARIKLINAIDRAFWDSTLTERLISKLPGDRLCVLSLLAFSYDAGVHEKVLFRKLEKLNVINRRDLKAILNELIPYALTGGVKEEGNLFFCPKGIAEQVRKSLIGDVISFSDTAGPVPSTSPPNLLEDIFSFLAEAYKGEISLTLIGKIKKAFLDRVFSGSITCSDPVLQLPEEPRNNFVIEYLKNRKLITFDRRKVRAAEKIGGWLKLSSTERFQDIVSFALTHTLQDDDTIIAFTGIIGETPAGATFEVSELAYFLHSGTTAQGGFSRIESRIREIVAILYHLGMLSFKNGRFIMTVTGEHFFSGKSIPMDDNTADFFTVQPNFEVIVGPELHPLVRFKLELLATRKNRDMVLTYEITRDGITRARERGVSTDEILNFFENHSRTPLPQNVRFSIENWSKAYGSIFFEQKTLMRFRDASICSSVMHLPKISPYIKEQLSDTSLVISGNSIPIITDILKNSGFQPEIFGETPADTALAGETYQQTGIDDILKEKSMPFIHSEFILPDDLLASGNS